MIDPKKFEELKKAAHAAAVRWDEAMCKAKAAREEFTSAERELLIARTALNDYYESCIAMPKPPAPPRTITGSAGGTIEMGPGFGY